MHADMRIHQALKALRDVESRPLHDILLDSVDVTRPREEAEKLIKIAGCYQAFVRLERVSDPDLRREAYLVLRAAYNCAYFPPRRYLSRRQFELLLDLHLDNF